MKVLTKIRDFFQCVRVTWMCRLYFALIVLLVTSTYVGQVMDTFLEDKWYSITVEYILGASVIYLTVFALYMTIKGLYNLITKDLK